MKHPRFLFAILASLSLIGPAQSTLAQTTPATTVSAATNPTATNLPAAIVAPRALPAATAERLRAILADPAVAQAHIGVSIVALGTVPDVTAFPSQPFADRVQPVLWQQDGARRFMPASNTKLYTAALALKVLGANHRFVTRVETRGVRNQSTLRGNVTLVGGGDPSLRGDDLRAIAKQVFASGIRRIEGDLIGDGTAFGAENSGGRYPDGWTLDDTLWYYGPEVSALAVNRNQVDVNIEATQPGRPARVTISPDGEGFVFRSDIRTVAASAAGADKTPGTSIQWERADQNTAIGSTLTLSGRIVAGEKASEGVAVPNPSLRAAQIFKRALQAQGIVVSGVARSHFTPVTSASLPAMPVSAARHALPMELARHQSPPLETLLAGFLKPSDNLYGEMLLRATALYASRLPRTAVASVASASGTSTPKATAQVAHSLLFAWLKVSGVDIEGVQLTDGSGLSRYNLITPRATTGLLAAVENLPDNGAYWNALPIAGVDGTLRRRMAGTSAAPDPATANVRAKTGSFSIVSTLSGYVTTQPSSTGQRHRYAVSVLCNFTRGDDARRVQNQIFSLLAGMKPE
ncbi:MAG: hypothetical protein JWN98_1420 [Abditibacteriota bacterium]|nr:hypothetical protein [Abditibacteriota bacterium]